MAAEMRHFRARQQVEQAVVYSGQATDQAKLSARAGVGTMIGVVARQSRNESLASTVLAAEQQVCLGQRRPPRNTSGRVPSLTRRDLGREQSGPLDVTGQEGEGGGVYCRVVAACPLVDSCVALRPHRGVGTLGLTLARKRDVLFDTRTEGCDLFVVNTLQPELDEASGCLVSRPARARASTARCSSQRSSG